MGTQAALSSFSLSPLSSQTFLSSSSSQSVSFKPFLLPFKHVNSAKSSKARTRATLDEKDKNPILVKEQQPNQEVEESVKAKVDPSGFLETLGGSESPGRTWMLIFTAEKQLKGGRYFPLTAVQRFDAAARRIENGVFLGPIGFLTFEGRFSWKNRILSFIFEQIRIKIGPLNPLQIGLGQKDDREPNTKDPFFIWFYIDEEIAVARGRSGGTAFWCRCTRVTT
ncbi:hypothetical protein V6N13_077491 [Hibiscus sabdariffa]|uniref:Uncharacterized protein n=1 Tax=Hibiscus sabdariffa TaxID=183260 RepID=A0ABR2CP17_9ROSI